MDWTMFWIGVSVLLFIALAVVVIDNMLLRENIKELKRRKSL